MKTILANAGMIEGEIMEIFFKTSEDENSFTQYREAYNKYSSEERIKILNESNIIEEEKGENEADRYFNEEEAKRVTPFKPVIDTSQIKQNFSGECNKGFGKITITLPKEISQMKVSTELIS